HQLLQVQHQHPHLHPHQRQHPHRHQHPQVQHPHQHQRQHQLQLPQAQHPRQPHQLLQVQHPLRHPHQRLHRHPHPHQPQPKQHQQHQHPHRHRHLQVQHPHQPQVKQVPSTSSTSTTSITTTTTSVALPAQCFSYTSITDATRLATYAGSGSVCDQSTFSTTPVWVRFSGAGGTMLVNYYPSIYRCHTDAPGWYTGSLPAVGSTVSGTVCYYWSGYTCNWSNSVSVTNCNGYYVYALIRPPVCNLRYCTM
ncbi:unnamed protein product, partial [Adineta steineri]